MNNIPPNITQSVVSKHLADLEVAFVVFNKQPKGSNFWILVSSSYYQCGARWLEKNMSFPWISFNFVSMLASAFLSTWKPLKNIRLALENNFPDTFHVSKLMPWETEPLVEVFFEAVHTITDLENVSSGSEKLLTKFKVFSYFFWWKAWSLFAWRSKPTLSIFVAGSRTKPTLTLSPWTLHQRELKTRFSPGNDYFLLLRKKLKRCHAIPG